MFLVLLSIQKHKEVLFISNLKKGFTLVELLFVMAIISILTGIGISQMSGSTDAAMKVKAKSDMRTAINMQQEFFGENGAYANIPDNLTFVSSNSKIEIRGEGAGINTSNGRGFTLVATINGVNTYCYDSSTAPGIENCGVEDEG